MRQKPEKMLCLFTSEPKATVEGHFVDFYPNVHRWVHTVHRFENESLGTKLDDQEFIDGFFLKLSMIFFWMLDEDMKKSEQVIFLDEWEGGNAIKIGMQDFNPGNHKDFQFNMPMPSLNANVVIENREFIAMLGSKILGLLNQN